jgi:hypothetical protein
LRNLEPQILFPFSVFRVSKAKCFFHRFLFPSKFVRLSNRGPTGTEEIKAADSNDKNAQTSVPWFLSERLTLSSGR